MLLQARNADRPCSHGPLDAVGQLPRSVAPAGAGCSPPVSASHPLPPLPQRGAKCNSVRVGAATVACVSARGQRDRRGMERKWAWHRRLGPS